MLTNSAAKRKTAPDHARPRYVHRKKRMKSPGCHQEHQDVVNGGLHCDGRSCRSDCLEHMAHPLLWWEAQIAGGSSYQHDLIDGWRCSRCPATEGIGLAEEIPTAPAELRHQLDRTKGSHEG